MSIFEYDEEKEMKLIRRDMMEIGREQGLQQGLQQGMRDGMVKGREEEFKEIIKNFIRVNLEEQIPEERIVTKLQKYFGVLPEEARRLISLYQKAE